MSTTKHISAYMTRLWRTVAVVSLAVVGVWLIGLLVTGLLILFAGVLFALFLSHLSRSIQRLSGFSYAASLGLVVFAILAILSATGYFMGSQISQQVSEFSEMFSTASDRTWSRWENLGLRRWVAGGGKDDAPGLLPSSVSLMSSARSALLVVLSALGGIVMIAFLGLYLAIDPTRYRQGLLRLLPPRRRPRIGEVVIEVGDTLWAWTLGRLASMALVAVASTAGLWLIGIPLPATQGVIAGLLNFVPNLGPLIASIPPLLFGLQIGGNSALYVAGFYLALQVVESYFITPLIDQQQVRLPPALTLAAQLLLGMLAGFMGLLLATPLTAAAHVFIRELYVKDSLERESAKIIPAIR